MTPSQLIAAEAAEPVAMSWRDAATTGIGLPALCRVVTGIVEAAASVAPAPVRAQVERWVDLPDQGRGPADLVTARAAASGPERCLADPGLR